MRAEREIFISSITESFFPVLFLWVISRTLDNNKVFTLCIALERDSRADGSHDKNLSLLPWFFFFPGLFDS